MYAITLTNQTGHIRKIKLAGDFESALKCAREWAVFLAGKMGLKQYGIGTNAFHIHRDDETVVFAITIHVTEQA